MSIKIKKAFSVFCFLFSRQEGISLIETLIAVAIGILFSMLFFVSLSSSRSRTEFNYTASQIGATLREAQTRALTQTSNATWGVHFENATATTPFFALFYGTYGTSTRVNYYAFPQSVTYATSSLALGSSTEVTFSQITGFPGSPASITIRTLSGNVSTTISINARGGVSY